MNLKNFPRRVLHAIWRHKYIWTFALFVFFVGFADENSCYNKYKLDRENAEKEAEIKAFEAQYAADQRKLNQLRTDPQALIRVAREDHRMQSADEDVYYIVDTDTVE